MCVCAYYVCQTLASQGCLASLVPRRSGFPPTPPGYEASELTRPGYKASQTYAMVCTTAQCIYIYCHMYLNPTRGSSFFSLKIKIELSQVYIAVYRLLIVCCLNDFVHDSIQCIYDHIYNAFTHAYLIVTNHVNYIYIS